MLDGFIMASVSEMLLRLLTAILSYFTVTFPSREPHSQLEVSDILYVTSHTYSTFGEGRNSFGGKTGRERASGGYIGGMSIIV